MKTPADIAVFGGARGGGKSYAILMESMRHLTVHEFNALVLRNTFKQITMGGGWWEMAMKWYPYLGGVPRRNLMEFEFPASSKVSFGYLETDEDALKYKGGSFCLLAFDQLEEHSSSSFFNMLATNRSACGIRPYVRASCNPDPDSWLRQFLSWWIDENTGFPFEERSGILRWFIRVGDELAWTSTYDEAVDKYKELAREHGDTVTEEAARAAPKSVTFIPSTVYDNRELLKIDPGYLGNLMSLPEIDRQRMLLGNWNIRPAAGLVFNRDWFEIQDEIPVVGTRCRAWDFAATEKKTIKDNPDWTAGVLGTLWKGVFYVEDIINVQAGPAQLDRIFLETTDADRIKCAKMGVHYAVRWEQEPAGAGKRETYRLVTGLQGVDAQGIPTGGVSKLLRARALVSQASHKNIKLKKAKSWNMQFLKQLHEFTGDNTRTHDDIVDATVLCYGELARTYGAAGMMF